MDSAAIASRDKLIASLRETVSEQQRLIVALEGANEELRRQLERLEGKVRELEPRKPKGMPGNKKGRDKQSEGESGEKERKKREMNYGRKRCVVPAVRVEHAVDKCSHCDIRLSGGTRWRTREVIEVVLSPALVTEHVYIQRGCPCCGKVYRPGPELDGIAVGKQRFGVGLVSLIVTLREKLRLPIRQIKWYLEKFHELGISCGAIVGVLQMVAQRGKAEAQRILGEIRSSDVVNADETGWREDGKNGYVWVYSTPTEKYFVRGDRSSEMVKRVLGESFQGVLVSDFYYAYNCYGGFHQRCWPHLLRDIHDLVEGRPGDGQLHQWAEDVRQLYNKAKLYAGLQSSKNKNEARLHFERELLGLCRAGLGDKDSPQHTLCKRIDQFLGELFVFVAQEGVPSDNNAAERDLRHLVTTRKISGGTRSPNGTETKMILSTLFGTWTARAINPLHACLQLLLSPQV
jgi:hypothetical protein